MSRVIKFRAWDPTSNKMHDFDAIRENSLDQFYMLNQTDDPCTELMQYTGLDDKNGVEIYEGILYMLT